VLQCVVVCCGVLQYVAGRHKCYELEEGVVIIEKVVLIEENIERYADAVAVARVRRHCMRQPRRKYYERSLYQKINKIRDIAEPLSVRQP